MKFSICLLATVLSLLPATTRAAENAQARLYCLSYRLNEATNIYGDIIKISSTSDDTGFGEMLPSQPPDTEINLPGIIDYASGCWFYDNTYLYWANYGTFYLNPPDFTDLNSNRYPDFFEIARPCSGSSAGSYSYYDPQTMEYLSGNITASWSRAAGSKIGTVTMVVVDTTYGDYWGTMYAKFEILEYKGSLAYTPGPTTVSGSLNLTQTGSNSTFTGSVQFVKSATNRFDSLILQPGALRDASALSTSYTNRYFLRDPNWPTNYAGYVQFDNDGDVTTFFPYAVWVLSLDDPNDANHNGIPDFSDDASVTPPAQPRLALAVTPSNCLLTVQGDVNHTVKIQENPSLTGSWTDVASFTLSNSPTVVPLTPSAKITFWRAMTQ